MKFSRDQTEFAEMSNMRKNKKVNDIQKSVRRILDIGQVKVHAVKDKQGNAISNFVDVVKAPEELNTDKYSTQSIHASFIESRDEKDNEAPSITRGKATKAGEDGITVDWMKDGRDTVLV